MATVSSSFTVPCPLDRTVLAIQDTLNQLGWPVHEVSSSLIVCQAPSNNPVQMANFPKVSAKLAETQEGTSVAVSVSQIGPMLGNKKFLTGILGQFTNSVSLRVQTESIAINPTVALGEGQGASSTGVSGPSPARDRALQLKDLKDLLDSGVLSAEEFATEKQRVLSGD